MPDSDLPLPAHDVGIHPPIPPDATAPLVPSGNQALLKAIARIPLPEPPPPPQFQIGQQVYWALVPTPDFGWVAGVIWSAEASVQATGYHYAIQLDPSSPSIADGITCDWAYESDLALLRDSGQREQEHGNSPN